MKLEKYVVNVSAQRMLLEIKTAEYVVLIPTTRQTQVYLTGSGGLGRSTNSFASRQKRHFCLLWLFMNRACIVYEKGMQSYLLTKNSME